MERQEKQKGYRKEYDTFGPIDVKKDRYWGAQTQRSLQNFAIGTAEDKMPLSLYKALAIVKKCAAIVNMKYNLTENIANAIIQSANEIIQTDRLDGHFPLVIFQTGSGTQSNMNMNEVISNRSTELLGGKLGDKSLVHPNDHVNRSQSSNDVFPTAMHVAIVIDLHKFLMPALTSLESNLAKKVVEFDNVIKIGRTHTQDATPLTLGQEFSSYHVQAKNAIKNIKKALPHLLELAQGGTAVGTGLNTFRGFDALIAREIGRQTNQKFRAAENKFEALSSHDAVVYFSGVLNGLATYLFKFAQDFKLLSVELKEFNIENITPCDELLQAAIQTIGNHTVVTLGNAQGHYNLNVFKPSMAAAVLNSIYVLSSAIHNFDQTILKLLKPDYQKIKDYMNNSLMLVTALNSHIGYDKAAQIAKLAHKEGLTLREGAIKSGHVTGEQFDEWVKPENMIRPSD